MCAQNMGCTFSVDSAAPWDMDLDRRKMILLEGFCGIDGCILFWRNENVVFVCEALIITAQDLKYRFRPYMKQNGGFACERLADGTAFATMLESGEYSQRSAQYACDAD